MWKKGSESWPARDDGCGVVAVFWYSKSSVCALECLYLLFQHVLVCLRILWQKYAFLFELLFMRIHYVLRRWTSCALCSVKGTARFILFLRNEMSIFSSTSFKLLQFLCIHCQTQRLLPMMLFKQEKKVALRQIHRPGRMAKLYLKGYRTFKRLSVLCK